MGNVAERIHRVTPGKARTWCGRRLDVAPPEGADRAPYRDKSGRVVSLLHITTGNAYNCGSCYRCGEAPFTRRGPA